MLIRQFFLPHARKGSISDALTVETVLKVELRSSTVGVLDCLHSMRCFECMINEDAGLCWA